MYKLNVELCKGRHDTPATDGAIFEGDITEFIADPEGLQKIAVNRIEVLMAESGVSDAQMNIFVTGLSVALVAAIQACYYLSVPVILWHFDRESNGYYPQPLVYPKK